MLFLTPNQQCQRTEDTASDNKYAMTANSSGTVSIRSAWDKCSCCHSQPTMVGTVYLCPAIYAIRQLAPAIVCLP